MCHMSTTNLKPCRTNNTYILIYYGIVQRNFTHSGFQVGPNFPYFLTADLIFLIKASKS